MENQTRCMCIKQSKLTVTAHKHDTKLHGSLHWPGVLVAIDISIDPSSLFFQQDIDYPLSYVPAGANSGVTKVTTE